MWAIIKLYWQPILSACLTLAASFAIGLTLHNLDVTRLKAKYNKRIEDQVAADKKDCQLKQQVTQGNNDDREDAILSLNNQLDGLRRKNGAACIPIITGQSDGMHKPAAN